MKPPSGTLRGLDSQFQTAQSAIIGLPVSYRTYRRDSGLRRMHNSGPYNPAACQHSACAAIAIGRPHSLIGPCCLSADGLYSPSRKLVFSFGRPPVQRHPLLASLRSIRPWLQCSLVDFSRPNRPRDIHPVRPWVPRNLWLQQTHSSM